MTEIFNKESQMKNVLKEKDIEKLVNEIVEGFVKSLNEAPPEGISQPQVQPKMQPTKVQRPVKKAVKPVVKKPVEKPVVKKPTSQTIPGPKDKVQEPVKKGYDPEQAKKKETLSKLGYQIFNIKMRLGKLGLNDTVRRFAQSMHDFDINVTKNSKDPNDIRSYLSPAQGNLVALKGALESLEAEFAELEKLLENE